MGEKAFQNEVRLRVRYQETDRMGVVYHANHLVYFEVGRTELMRKKGVRYADLEREGFLLAVTEAHARFLGSVTYDDEIAVQASVRRDGKTKLRFDYRVVHVEGGAPVCEGYTVHALLGEGRRPARIPDWVARAIDGPGGR